MPVLRLAALLVVLGLALAACGGAPPLSEKDICAGGTCDACIGLTCAQNVDGGTP
jgi:hypothetical protein